MPIHSRDKQRGAVLAFSLVMLLLLTLVSISMIQQNKNQITVSTNAGQQVKAFATVETALRYAQGALETARYLQDTGKANHHCKSGATDSLHPAPHSSAYLTGLPTNITAEIQAVYCLSSVNNNGIGLEARCIYSATGVRNMVVGDPEPTADNVAACSMLANAGGWTPGHGNPGACPTEVYTLNVTLDDPNSLAKRTVESKFLLDCSNDVWDSTT